MESPTSVIVFVPHHSHADVAGLGQDGLPPMTLIRDPMLVLFPYRDVAIALTA